MSPPSPTPASATSSRKRPPRSSPPTRRSPASSCWAAPRVAEDGYTLTLGGGIGGDLGGILSIGNAVAGGQTDTIIGGTLNVGPGGRGPHDRNNTAGGTATT